MAGQVALGTRVRALGRLEADGTLRVGPVTARPQLPVLELPAADPDRRELPVLDDEVSKPVSVTPVLVAPVPEKIEAPDLPPEVLKPMPVETPERPDLPVLEIPKIPDRPDRPERPVRRPDFERPPTRIDVRPIKPDLPKMRPKK